MSRVLVLEEDLDLAALFRLLLEDEGFEVAVVGCPAEVEAEISARPPALILVELAMDASHRRTLADMRRTLAGLAPSTPTLLCTSTPSITRTSAAIAGFEGYLQMPFDVGDATAEVERVLNRTQLAVKSTDDRCPCCGA